MNFDTIVTGGKVVTPSGVVETDIGIREPSSTPPVTSCCRG
jgi:hypothetical protein